MTDGAGMTLNALKLIQEALQETGGETVTLPRSPLNDLLGRTIAQAEENERLREALEWYAEPSIYQQEHFEGTGMEYPALVDGGHSARLALSAAEAPAGRDG